VALEAAQGPAEDAHKVTLWELMNIGLKSQRPEAARDQCWRFRHEMGWAVPPEVQSLEKTLHSDLAARPHPTAVQWKVAARQHWGLHPPAAPQIAAKAGVENNLDGLGAAHR